MKRVSRSAVTYPRKRAVTACQICRLRKTKCDNNRPSCSFCLSSGRVCVYDDSQVDQSKFDPASLAILSQINVVLSELNTVSSKLDGASVSNGGKRIIANPYSLNAAPGVTNMEHVLAWPIYDDVEGIRNLIYDYREHDDKLLETPMLMDVVDRTKVPELVQQFFHYVHTKNPICNVRVTEHYANEISRTGFGWNFESCIILLICALGAIAGPTKSEQDRLIAIAYFVEARKRIAFVKHNTLQAAQCYFFCGMFRMYNIQPVIAWQEFHQACLIIRTFLLLKDDDSGSNKANGTTEPKGERRSSTTKHGYTMSVEQRLFWSSLKSETELSLELCFPTSGLANIKYPDLFPSPPTEEEGEIDEKAWFFYLTELMLRRTTDNVINAFYCGEPSEWLTTPTRDLIDSVKVFEDRLDDCKKSIASSLQFHYGATPGDELTYVTKGRFVDAYEYLYRPLVYCAIHGSSDPALRPYVDKYVYYVTTWSDTLADVHRHHGTWYYVRFICRVMVVLMGLVKAQVLDRLPVDLDTLMTRCNLLLSRWEGESPDLSAIKDILNTLWMTVSEQSLSPDTVRSNPSSV